MRLEPAPSPAEDPREARALRPYREPASAASRALLLTARAEQTEASRRELRAACGSLGQPILRRAAQQNRCEALVGVTLRELLGEAFDPSWRRAVEENRARVDALTGALLEALQALEACGARGAVIEGGSTVFSAGLAPAAYGAGDFDLLVDEDRFNDCLEALAARGFQAPERAGRAITSRVQLRHPSTVRELWIEVGARAFDRLWVPLRLKQPAAHWLARRQPGVDPRVWVLHPSDALCVALVHASLHSYVLSPALRLQVDIDRAARHPGVDWDEVTHTLREMGAATRAFASLMLARALLGTPIPEQALTRLMPNGARWDSLRRLLEAEGVLTDGRPKLRGSSRVRLDYLLWDAPRRAWLQNLLWPEATWLARHHGPLPLWRAQARRYLRLGRARLGR
ncbi:MAG: nucleotidyltransferase family protein [Polyangiaceae bacterium]|nr:nucleotidyltransferase family protein [Polyangiaceae bacterium]MCW5791058.1 nucleotidyltransferase family protein [Polyangiaceae bacterium]